MVTKAESRKYIPSKMPIMVHLREMRDRLVRSVIVVAITTGLAFVFAPQIFEILKAPAQDANLVYIELTEFISTFFKVSLAAGIIAAMPFLVYQLFGFVAPALTSKEKGYIYRILPAVTIMFFIGVAFAYYVALPPALSFLFNFGSGIAESQIRIENYISVVIRLILLVGLVFETPIIIMLMARLGLVTPQWLAKRRKLWIILAFVIAAIITPTFDPINQMIIAFPLIILLELSIWLSRLVYKKRGEAAPAAGS
ncbi:MAG: twin-arginine translocase subunit TatC [Dehalococcoidales bacterium]|nr:twin-arginine translocase subunit TatC [Dehalococcoidales bacterium]